MKSGFYDLVLSFEKMGVDVILDKWDLKEGNDANAFMEKMVSDEEIKKVILVIDEQYSDKANAEKRRCWHRNPDYFCRSL